MKFDHRIPLVLVAVTTLNAVRLCAIGQPLASFYAFACAGLVVLLAKDEVRFVKAIQLANEANDGWAASIKQNGELIERMAALLRRTSPEVIHVVEKHSKQGRME